MMAAPMPGADLFDRLPPVRGRLAAAVALDRMTWFRVGGPAQVVFRPADVDDLAALMAGRPHEFPVMAIGVGSNLLVRDGGVSGIVVRLARGFVHTRAEGDRLIVGAGALDANAALAAADAGIAGLEFLCGIPGTIGGAVRMNAGAYGTETRDVLVAATVVLPDGRVERLGPGDLGLSYRHSALPPEAVVVEAEFRGLAGDKAAITARMAEIRASREATQPIRERTGGSTFANPPGAKAWRLIDAAGCRGLAVGDARVSEKHCNFLINAGGARAADLETLGETVRRRVRETSGIDLRWEIRRVGVDADTGEGEKP